MLKVTKEDFKTYQKNRPFVTISPQAEAVRDGRAFYYVIKKKGKFITDFVVFIDDENWLGIDDCDLIKEEILLATIEYLKNEFDYVTIYIASEKTMLISMIKNRLNVTDISEICQTRVSDEKKFYYKKLVINLK